MPIPSNYVMIDNETLSNIATTLKNKPGAKAIYTPAEFASSIEQIMNVDEFLSYASTASVIDLSSLCTNRIVGGLLTYKSNITTVYGSNISYIGNRAFSRCTNLSYISIPNVEYIGNSAFCRCFSLTNSCIQEILDNYKSYSTIINSDTFAYCSIATSLDLTGYTRIERSAFEYCRDLVSINTPNCEYINDYAFYYCSNLSYISPMSSCSYIGSSAFYSCFNLSYISIPNCSYIGSNAFYNCSKLSYISPNHQCLIVVI